MAKMTEEMCEEAYRLYTEQNYPQNRIARLMDVSPSTISKAIEYIANKREKERLEKALQESRSQQEQPRVQEQPQVQVQVQVQVEPQVQVEQVEQQVLPQHIEQPEQRQTLSRELAQQALAAQQQASKETNAQLMEASQTTIRNALEDVDHKEEQEGSLPGIQAIYFEP